MSTMIAERIHSCIGNIKASCGVDGINSQNVGSKVIDEHFIHILQESLRFRIFRIMHFSLSF